MRTPVIAWSRGSVPEVIEDGVTGFIVESEAQALTAIGRIHCLDRRRIRERFDQRFTVRRMAEEYVASYRMLRPSRMGSGGCTHEAKTGNRDRAARRDFTRSR
jgi:glycosyltransferase involved in cell wall biosynthesis